MSEDPKDPVAPEGADEEAKTDEAPKDEAPAAKDEAPAAKDEAPAAKDEAPAAKSEAPAATDEAPAPKAWAAPLDRFDRAWTKLEARLCAIVLVAEILTLVFWISIKALSTSGNGGSGALYRSLLCALVFGLATHWLARKLERREVATTAAVVAGIVAGRYWGDFGTAYFSNFLAWMQNASILVFFGGVSELAKKLTLWLALLGASVATAQGKHINVDVAMRFLSPRARVPVAVLGWMTAAVVCGAASWGFFDHIAVEEYRADTSVPCPGDPSATCAAPPSSKVDKVVDDVGRDLFLGGRQLSLDLRTFPRVLSGTPYAQTLTAREWNAWIKGGDWDSHFAQEEVDALLLPEDQPDMLRTPAVTSVPGATERVPKLLSRLFDFVFPFGLLIIALRFVLRSLLALTGWVKVDPNAAHGEEDFTGDARSSEIAEEVAS